MEENTTPKTPVEQVRETLTTEIEKRASDQGAGLEEGIEKSVDEMVDSLEIPEEANKDEYHSEVHRKLTKVLGRYISDPEYRKTFVKAK